MDTSPNNDILSQSAYEIFLTQAPNATPIHIKVNTTSQSLAEALWLSGKINPVPLCSGLGRCGVCKVRFIQNAPETLDIEKKILRQKDLTEGWRLACRQNIAQLFSTQKTLYLELPASQHKKDQSTLSIMSQEVKLAVDVGTTSLCWQIIDSKGAVLKEGSDLNPQMGAGADIISRLRFATQPQGKKRLSHMVQKSLQEIISSLPSGTKVQEIGIAANTAMTAIFLEKNIEGLCHAPYALPFTGHNIEHIVALPPIYIPVQLAPFVGGDISAGYAALMAKQEQGEAITYPFLLADLGTNGEFILALNSQKAYVCSVPMGPALEGIGLSYGHMVDGSPGIVHAVRLDPTAPTGLNPCTLDGLAPQKICGTGYLSLIKTLYKVGILSADGLFTTKPKGVMSPLYSKIAKQLMTQEEELALCLWPEKSTNPMYLYAKDIEEVLKVKAAFSLAMTHLLATAKLKPKDLRHIFLAGAMGKHVQVQDLEALGFVPAGAGTRILSLGNSALEGMRHLLSRPYLREALYQWSKGCTLIHLTEDEHFTEKFMQHMNFSYTG